jgi:putative DNA primase/helicase
MDKIFEEWVGKDHVRTLYEFLAFCMLPDYPIHRIFSLVGAGMNGKTCFLRLLKKFVGDENVTATELDTLISSRFEITRLYKKLVCIMGETNFSELSKTSVLKKASGQDMIGFEYKNKTPFTDTNYAKIVIATNNLPETTDKTIGFYRRWMIIDFPNQFTEEKDILGDIPEQEYECLALKCCSILHDLLKVRKFTNEGSVEDRQKRYEEKSNPADKFIREFCDTEDGNRYIWKYDFEKKFNQWAKENRFREFSDVAIGKKMKERGFEVIRKIASWLNDGKGGQLRAYSGIRWKE